MSGQVSRLAQSKPSFSSQNTIKDEITRQPFYRLMHTYWTDISRIKYRNPVIQFFPSKGEIEDHRVIVAVFYKAKRTPIFMIFYDTQRKLFGFEDLSLTIRGKVISGNITEDEVEGTVTYFCKYLDEYFYIFEPGVIGEGDKYLVLRNNIKKNRTKEEISFLVIGSDNFYDFYEYSSNE
jgi:hypothetical protein